MLVIGRLASDVLRGRVGKYAERLLAAKLQLAGPSAILGHCWHAQAQDVEAKVRAGLPSACTSRSNGRGGGGGGGAAFHSHTTKNPLLVRVRGFSEYFQALSDCLSFANLKVLSSQLGLHRLPSRRVPMMLRHPPCMLLRPG